MFDAARQIVLASFPEGLTEIEIKRGLCERFYGDEVDVQAFVEMLAFQTALRPVGKPPVQLPQVSL